MRFNLITLFMLSPLLVLAAWAAGQDADTVAAVQPSLTSIAGIAMLTLLIVQPLKIFARSVPVLKSVPIVVIAQVIAAIITVVASLTGRIEGELLTLVFASIGAATSAIGVHQTATNMGDTPKSNTPVKGSKYEE